MENSTKNNKRWEQLGQDGNVDKRGIHLLLQPHHNYNQTTKQPSFRTTENLAEWKPYN